MSVRVCISACAVDFQSKHCGFDPAEYGLIFLSSPSLSLGGYQQPNVYNYMSLCGGKKEEKKRRKKWNCHWPKTATVSRVV